MSEAWREYKGDFDTMTDEQIEEEVKSAIRELIEAESWLEAVASWKDAGKPREKQS